MKSIRWKPYRRQNSVGQNLISAFTVSGLPTSSWVLLCAVSTSSSSLSLWMRFRFKFFAFLFSYRVELSSLPRRWVQDLALALPLSHGDCDMQPFGVEIFLRSSSFQLISQGPVSLLTCCPFLLFCFDHHMYSIYQFAWRRDLSVWKRDINFEYKDKAKTAALVINYEKRISSDINLSADV